MLSSELKMFASLRKKPSDAMVAPRSVAVMAVMAVVVAARNAPGRILALALMVSTRMVTPVPIALPDAVLAHLPPHAQHVRLLSILLMDFASARVTTFPTSQTTFALLAPAMNTLMARPVRAAETTALLVVPLPTLALLVQVALKF